MPSNKRGSGKSQKKKPVKVQTGQEESEKTIYMEIQKMKKEMINPSYHYSYNQNSVANIPNLLHTTCQDEDKETLILAPPEPHQTVTPEQMKRLKQKLKHLSFEKVLQVLYINDYDVEATIEMASDLEHPDLLPEAVKKFFIANIAMERFIRPSRGKRYKHFYFEEMFGKIVETKALVDFYYSEKNRLGVNNWRMDMNEIKLTAEQQVELAKRMKANNISFVGTHAQYAFDSAEAMEILKTIVPQPQEEDITSENSEAEDKPATSSYRPPNYRPIFQPRATTPQPKSHAVNVPGTSSPSPSITKPVPRRSGRLSNDSQ